MFSDAQESKTIDVFVVLTDGRELQGALASGLTTLLPTALNGEGQFIELIDASGHSIFIAKHQVATIEKLKKGGRALPALQASALDALKWHEVLGVSASAGMEETKQAYHALAKQYHPDLYPDHIPSEMRHYASEMFSRINKAYEAFQQVKVAA